jgi:hypothetical protein
VAVQVLTPRALALPLLLGACSSNHHVSPFPPIDLAAALRLAENLDAQLARVSEEARATGLRQTLRIDGTLPGGKPFVALGFTGFDDAGLPTQATRVVTPAAVVLALGPARLALRDPPRPDTLLPSLLPSGAFPSGADLNGDRSPDLALSSSDGSFAIYRVDLLGASPYPVQLRASPTRVLDVNEDGRPDLAGSPPLPDGDSIRPEFLDIAVADPTGFRNDHPDALAHHRALAEAPTPPSTAPIELRIRRALERGFHLSCAGDAPRIALQPAIDLIAEHSPLPPALAASWRHWHGWLQREFSL